MILKRLYLVVPRGSYCTQVNENLELEIGNYLNSNFKVLWVEKAMKSVSDFRSKKQVIKREERITVLHFCN